jgi:hypothetical protein
MLSIRSSLAQARNPDFKEVKRQPREDNLKWIARNASKEKETCLILLGGNNAVNFRLRVAQSHARHDLTPSSWSHVVLCELPCAGPTGVDFGKTDVYEISMEPPRGFEFPPVTNGVQKNPLQRYRSAKDWPNIAIVHVPKEMQDVERMIKRFEHQRAALDTVDLLLNWLAFVWGTARTGNPLLEGKGIPSATMVEYVVGALQYELTPGLDSRSSCPEAIWQAASWWHEYYEESGCVKLKGAWVVDHVLVE